jgi:hypothetical protein
LKKALSLLLPLLVAACAAQEAKRPAITGVAHISLFVHDIEQSRHFTAPATLHTFLLRCRNPMRHIKSSVRKAV